MRVLFLGDIVGRPGRHAVRATLARAREDLALDFVIANCENAAGGLGITAKIADALLAEGIDVLTSGNHIWAKKDMAPYLDEEPRVLRPENYPGVAPGRGYEVYEGPGSLPVAVVNLQGQVFFDENVDNPFRVADTVLQDLSKRSQVIIVDFHAEATSEKRAFGYYLDGRVSAVLGTHTHVQTADEQILPGGTAYITDAGMSGASESVIGIQKDLAIERFLTQRPVRFSVAKGSALLCGVVLDIDQLSGRARDITRFRKEVSKGELAAVDS